MSDDLRSLERQLAAEPGNDAVRLRLRLMQLRNDPPRGLARLVEAVDRAIAKANDHPQLDPTTKLTVKRVVNYVELMLADGAPTSFFVPQSVKDRSFIASLLLRKLSGNVGQKRLELTFCNAYAGDTIGNGPGQRVAFNISGHVFTPTHEPIVLLRAYVQWRDYVILCGNILPNTDPFTLYVRPPMVRCSVQGCRNITSTPDAEGRCLVCADVVARARTTIARCVQCNGMTSAPNEAGICQKCADTDC